MTFLEESFFPHLSSKKKQMISLSTQRNYLRFVFKAIHSGPEIHTEEDMDRLDEWETEPTGEYWFGEGAKILHREILNEIPKQLGVSDWEDQSVEEIHESGEEYAFSAGAIDYIQSEEIYLVMCQGKTYETSWYNVLRKCDKFDKITRHRDLVYQDSEEWQDLASKKDLNRSLTEL